MGIFFSSNKEVTNVQNILIENVDVSVTNDNILENNEEIV
jgi:hypothetical protein